MPPKRPKSCANPATGTSVYVGALEKWLDVQKFNFLTVHERALLEEAISQEQLENNEDNGQSCIAHYWVGKRSDNLCFEATVEDDGSCIFLLTPYDKKEFVDLNNCLTDDW